MRPQDKRRLCDAFCWASRPCCCLAQVPTVPGRAHCECVPARTWLTRFAPSRADRASPRGWATGAGKSLCYQLPARVFSRMYRAITVVVTPLVALMFDQLQRLPRGLVGALLHGDRSVRSDAPAAGRGSSVRSQAPLTQRGACACCLSRRLGCGSRNKSTPSWTERVAARSTSSSCPRNDFSRPRLPPACSRRPARRWAPCALRWCASTRSTARPSGRTTFGMASLRHGVCHP